MKHNYKNCLNLIFFSCLILWCFTLCAQESYNATTPAYSTKVKKDNRPIKVFLLAGQSNMGGKADGEQLSEEEKKMLANAGKQIQFYYNRKYQGPLQLTEAMTYDRENYQLEKSFGPEIFFGIEMIRAYPDDKFIFIKRSNGGTSLYGCWNAHYDSEKAKVMEEENEPMLYSDFQNYIGEVLKNYDPSAYTFAGMLWVQGEADSKVEIAAKSYGQNLRKLIKGMRKYTEEPKLPFIIFQVGSGKVVEGMKVTAKHLRNVSLITQNKNPLSENYYPEYEPPKSHYTYAGMKKIGKRFAEEYISISNFGY